MNMWSQECLMYCAPPHTASGALVPSFTQALILFPHVMSFEVCNGSLLMAQCEPLNWAKLS